MTMTIRLAAIAVSAVAALAATFAAAQTRFDHNAPGYVVPEKRVQIAANRDRPERREARARVLQDARARPTTSSCR
jgi:hypothetical protein